MSVIVEKILPVILIFFLGFLLKKVKVLSSSDGALFLKLFFYVAIPALIVISVAKMQFSLQLLWLPFISIAIILISYLVSFYLGRCFKLPRASFGVFLLGSLIMNTGFTFPFILALTGEDGLARAAFFDLGNTFLVFTLVYYLACKYGRNENNLSGMAKKFLSCPPLVALIAGLFMCVSHLQLAPVLDQSFKILGNMTVPLMMLALGTYFEPRIVRFGPLVSVIAIRMGLGLLLGLLLVHLVKLEGLNKIVVLVCGAAPSGITTLVFSSIEDMDTEFAASIVSYSTIIGIVAIPLLLIVTHV